MTTMIPKAPTAPQILPADPFTDPLIARRLAGYNVRSAADWARLSRSQRRGLFGITRRLVEQLDAAAKAAK
jgi:hypothetical protein